MPGCSLYGGIHSQCFYAVFASALNCGRNVPILYVKVPGAIFRYQSGFLAEHFNAIRATYFHI